MVPSRATAWIVWIIASFFYAYQYILRVMPNIMMNDIVQQFNIDAATFGQFSGVYYIGYSLMHLPVGIMLDRHGPKRVMPVCILLTVVGLLPLIFSTFWVYPIIGRALIGIGSSAAILGVFKIIRLTFAEAHFTRMLSFSVMIGLLGAIYGGGPVNYLCTTFGYKTVVGMCAMVGVALALVTYLLVPEAEETTRASAVADVKAVLSNMKVLFVCILAGLMVGPLEGFADVWGTEFLKRVYNFDPSVAASLPSLIFLGMCFGAPVLSVIAERVGYLLTIIASGVIMAGCFGLLVQGGVSLALMNGMFVVVGVCSAYQVIAIYLASTYVKEQYVGLTTAVANMIIMIFGYIFHSAIGGVVQKMGGTTSAAAFKYGIAVIPIALAISVVGYLVLAGIERMQRA